MTHILQCVWPIVDETYRRSELIAEALDGLDHLAEQAGAMIDGPPLWDIVDADRVPGWRAYAPGSVLIARAPATRYEVEPEPEAPRNRRGPAVDMSADIAKVEKATAGHLRWNGLTAGEKNAAVTRLTESGMNDTQIGARLGTSRDAVAKHRTRHGIESGWRAA